jgi:hypothetical protein
MPVPGPVPLGLVLPLVVLPAGSVLLGSPAAAASAAIVVSAGEVDVEDEAAASVPVVVLVLVSLVPLLPQPLSSAPPSTAAREIWESFIRSWLKRRTIWENVPGYTDNSGRRTA